MRTSVIQYIVNWTSSQIDFESEDLPCQARPKSGYNPVNAAASSLYRISSEYIQYMIQTRCGQRAKRSRTFSRKRPSIRLMNENIGHTVHRAILDMLADRV